MRIVEPCRQGGIEAAGELPDRAPFDVDLVIGAVASAATSPGPSMKMPIAVTRGSSPSTATQSETSSRTWFPVEAITAGYFQSRFGAVVRPIERSPVYEMALIAPLHPVHARAAVQFGQMLTTALPAA